MRLRKKKKSGNTLVETIAAIAIILIGLEAVIVSYTTSSKMWQNENKRLDTSTFNQTICQNIRKKEKPEVESIYLSELLSGDKYVNAFIYFDNYEELIGTGNDADTDVVREGVIGYSPSYTFVNDTDVDSQEKKLSKCRELNVNGKQFGALISIVDDRDSGLDLLKNGREFSIYRIKVTVWNLTGSAGYPSETSFFLGG